MVLEEIEIAAAVVLEIIALVPAEPVLALLKVLIVFELILEVAVPVL